LPLLLLRFHFSFITPCHYAIFAIIIFDYYYADIIFAAFPHTLLIRHYAYATLIDASRQPPADID
jgi:hypothetical protein